MENSFKRSEINSGALLNTNNDALLKYKKTKKRMQKINNIEGLEDRIDRLEMLLEKVLNKLNAN